MSDEPDSGENPKQTNKKEAAPPVPDWAKELIALYESQAANQFILHGNVTDHMILPDGDLGDLQSFLVESMLPSFDVILSYDLGNGVRVLKGQSTLGEWPSYTEPSPFSRKPRAALDRLTHYLRYCANLGKTSTKQVIRVAVILKSAHLILPAGSQGVNHDLSSMALLVRDWSSDPLLHEHPLATFLVSPNLNDLHPLLVNHLHTARVDIPLPEENAIHTFLNRSRREFPTSLAGYVDNLDQMAAQLKGATLSSIGGLLRRHEYEKKEIEAEQLADLKKSLVEDDCNGLIEFIESDKSLDMVYGHEAVKAWMKQDIALWQQGDLAAMPMGYLLCGPVGTGKTFLVECLAGDVGVPVVKFKNFRDRWVGSTESNLEKIFRLLHALGRCIVFVDEADQAMGRRTGGSGDSGVSGRVYSMMAEEMSDTDNRGKILWILASSRPDLIEVDLKRPGRVDVKIPLFPAVEKKECYLLIRALCKKHRLSLPKSMPKDLASLIPSQVTPGAAESLAIKVYRHAKTTGKSTIEALKTCLDGYQDPVPREIMDFQIQLAIEEASDLSFVPPHFAD